MPLDRASERRTDDDFLAAAAADPRARAVLLGRGQVALGADRSLRHGLGLAGPDAELTFLGVEDDGAPLFAARAPEELPDGVTLQHPFAVLAGLEPADAAVLSFALGLFNWRRTHRFCGVCGTATVVEEAGHVLRCTNPDCATRHFPRTDAVVQILVEDGERIVLGRNREWPPRFHSVLAGFVEPGETPAEAAIRETREEIGLDVLAIEARGEQPWPMPHQLLIAHVARVADASGAVASEELESIRVLTRDELRAALAGKELFVPPPAALAGQLIGRWLDG